MSPPNLYFWSISRKEGPESILDGMEELNGRKHPFLTEFVLIMNSCFQYNAPLVENTNVAQEVNALSKKLFVFSQL